MAFYVDTNYQGQIPSRPNDDVSPVKKQKDPKYTTTWLKYIYSQHINGRTGIKYANSGTIDTMRAYAYGRQNPAIYKKWFQAEDNNTAAYASSVDTASGNEQSRLNKSRKHFMDVDFDTIYSPAPKYMNNLLGRFMKINLDVTVEALDEKSGMEKEMNKWRKWAQAKSAAMVAKVNAIRGQDPGEQQLMPESIEELNLMSEMGMFKTVYEVAMEKALEFTSEISEEEEIKQKVLHDIITANIGCYMDYVDTTDGLVKYRYIDPGDLAIEYSSRDDFSKSRYGGYMVDFRVADLRDKLPNVTEAELQGLCERYAGKYGNPGEVDSKFYEAEEVWGYDNFHVPVFYGAFLTTDKHHYTERVNSKGEKITTPEPEDEEGNIKPKSGKNRKTYPMYIKRVYEGYWVVGTEHVFDYGIMGDQPYDMKKRQPVLPFHIIKIKGKSIMEQMAPMLDQCQMTYLRLQNAIAKAPPPGLKIDIGKMKNMKIGKNKWTPLDLIKLYTQTGHMLYDSSINRGQLMPGQQATDPGKAIEELTGGVGTAINDAIRSFEMAFQSISELTGIDRASAVSPQDSRTTAAETKISATGTADTLFLIISSWAKLKKKAANCAALRIQSRCNVDSSPYLEPLGGAMVEAIKLAASVPPVVNGIFIKAQPTDDEKADILQKVDLGIQSGILTMSQALFIEDTLRTGGGINYAQRYLAYLEGKSQKQQAEAAQANQEADTKKQMMVMEQKAKAEAELEVLKGEIERQNKTHEVNEEIRRMRTIPQGTPQNPQ